MKIMLIGMSGIGKTYWSQRIASELGFERIGIDDQINHILAKKLADFGVKNDFESISRWRGLPYQDGFLEKQHIQIDLEETVLSKVLQEIKELGQKDIVVDASGSVIYAEDETLKAIRAEVTTVYIQASPEEVDDLYTQETIFEKPLIWGNHFSMQEGESVEQAMRRSFREVLFWRMAQYEKLADISISRSDSRSLVSAQEFLNRAGILGKG